MRKKMVSVLFVATLLTGAAVLALPTYANNQNVYTAESFVELLISKGIISEDAAQKARSLVASFAQNATIADLDDTEDVVVTVSQLIEHSDRTYSQFENIQGLILLAKNTSENQITLRAKRGCQVTYEIRDAEGKSLYDSATRAKCQSSEMVSYSLNAGQTRMFQITHNESTHHLKPGEYMFTMRYPEYGEGTVSVTIR